MEAADSRDIIVLDFEFYQRPGEKLKVICVSWRNLRTGESGQLWLWGSTPPATPPYPIGKTAVIVAFFASAEMACHLALGWPIPENVIDLYAEYRVRTNGVPSPFPNSLLGACQAFGIPGIAGLEKAEMRDLCIRGGPYTPREQEDLLQYNESDVIATTSLFLKMENGIDVPRALFRGRYMAAVATMETTGVPIDSVVFQRLVERGPEIERQLIERVDAEYHVYEDGRFREDLFVTYCIRHQIAWPMHVTGRPDLRDDTFERMARRYPQFESLRQARKAVVHLRSCKLTVGSDGRNRCLLSPYSSRTGRNQPSSNKFVLGPGAWIRGMIMAPAARAVGYLDFSQQEFCIAAAMTGDNVMLQAYESDDPYLAFAKQAKAVPQNATKSSHGEIREQYKRCALAVQYGMGEGSLGEQLGIGGYAARQLIEAHRSLYSTFWAGSQLVQDSARCGSRLCTPFGWYLKPPPAQTAASLRNFPVQATGADILRLACMAMIERGIMVCAPLHDAVLIEAASDEIEAVCEQARQLMTRAAIETIGVPIRTDVRIARHPERLSEPRGEAVWNMIMELLGFGAGESGAKLDSPV